MNNGNQQYDVQKRAKASTRATLRAVVSLYLIYLGYTILKSTVRGESTLPLWLGWTAGIVFIVGALGFCVYIYRRWRMDLEAARLTPPDQEPEALTDMDTDVDDTAEE